MADGKLLYDADSADSGFVINPQWNAAGKTAGYLDDFTMVPQRATV